MAGLLRLTEEQVARLSTRDLRRYLALHAEEKRRSSGRKLFGYYPEFGPLRRDLYPRHMEFFRAGAGHNERLFLAANRVGKTEGAGGFETTLHLTGRYPEWWEGHRFEEPIDAWAAGKTTETTRDIVQAKLFGETLQNGGRKGLAGNGLVPRDDIGSPVWKRGSELLDRVRVRHYDRDGKQDGWSRVALKSYEQGRGGFEGTEKHLVWLDEEPPLAVYTECLLRTMTTQGLVMITFTPLEGMSEVVLSFLPNGELPERYGGVDESDVE